MCSCVAALVHVALFGWTPAILQRGAMRLIGLVVALAISLTLVPLAAPGQHAGKFTRIGYIHVSPVPSSPSPNGVAFRQGLRDLGWVEGSNLTIESRSANGKPERLPALVAEIDAAQGGCHLRGRACGGLGGEAGDRRSADRFHDPWRSRGWRTCREPCPPGRESDRVRRDGPPNSPASAWSCSSRSSLGLPEWRLWRIL